LTNTEHGTRHKLCWVCSRMHFWNDVDVYSQLSFRRVSLWNVCEQLVLFAPSVQSELKTVYFYHIILVLHTHKAIVAVLYLCKAILFKKITVSEVWTTVKFDGMWVFIFFIFCILFLKIYFKFAVSLFCYFTLFLFILTLGKGG